MAESYAFQAEIKQLMSLIINAFYSNKEIFLRELVSNASDAIDKIRHISLSDASVLKDNEKLEIRVIPDKVNKCIIIEDSGIGMTKADLINNLGTIASSGTKKFMESMQEGKADMSLIGQFGVGFYSSYLVADRVRVVTKHIDEPHYTWESNAGGTFTIEESSDEDKAALKRGTRIFLYLKEDMLDMIEESFITETIKKYTGFIKYPISIQVTRTVTVDAVQEEAVAQDGDVEEVKSEVEVEVAPATVEETSFEQINTETPIWLRPAAEVTKEEYVEFYKTFTFDRFPPCAFKHFAVEGQLEFTGLIYAPKPNPMEFMDKSLSNLKLFVKRVFIMDDCKELVPEYLSFLKGVIDSNDLPLNVSREMLQQTQVVKQIKKTIVRRAIDMMTDLAAENADGFMEFYGHYHKNIKLGIHEDRANRDKLVELLRFKTSKTSDEDMVTFKTYVERMKPTQTDIYYIIGESYLSVKQSPFIEGLAKKGIEVLFMTDPIDEYMMQQLPEYKDKKFVCCSKDKQLVVDDEDELKQVKADNDDLCKYLKEVLGEDIVRAQVTTRLVDSPCVLVTDEHGWSANMERIMSAQAVGHTSPAMKALMKARKVLEINPKHKLIQHIKTQMTESGTKDLVQLLYESAMLHSGFVLENPTAFVKRLHRLIACGISLDEDEVSIPIEEPIDITEVTCDLDAVD